jgi:hypothetical protein
VFLLRPIWFENDQVFKIDQEKSNMAEFIEIFMHFLKIDLEVFSR